MDILVKQKPNLFYYFLNWNTEFHVIRDKIKKSKNYHVKNENKFFFVISDQFETINFL